MNDGIAICVLLGVGHGQCLFSVGLICSWASQLAVVVSAFVSVTFPLFT